MCLLNLDHALLYLVRGFLIGLIHALLELVLIGLRHVSELHIKLLLMAFFDLGEPSLQIVVDFLQDAFLNFLERLTWLLCRDSLVSYHFADGGLEHGFLLIVHALVARLSATVLDFFQRELLACQHDANLLMFICSRFSAQGHNIDLRPTRPECTRVCDAIYLRNGQLAQDLTLCRQFLRFNIAHHLRIRRLFELVKQGLRRLLRLLCLALPALHILARVIDDGYFWRILRVVCDLSSQRVNFSLDQIDALINLVESRLCFLDALRGKRALCLDSLYLGGKVVKLLSRVHKLLACRRIHEVGVLFKPLRFQQFSKIDINKRITVHNLTFLHQFALMTEERSQHIEHWADEPINVLTSQHVLN